MGDGGNFGTGVSGMEVGEDSGVDLGGRRAGRGVEKSAVGVKGGVSKTVGVGRDGAVPGGARELLYTKVRVCGVWGCVTV